MKVFKNNVQGKPGDYTMATQLLNFTNTSSDISSTSNSNSSSLTVVEKTSEEPDVKDKLKELKAMLDEGLISQEQYDTKSTKLLEDF
jgi:multidrug efflux pump subunit AcrB